MSVIFAVFAIIAVIVAGITLSLGGSKSDTRAPLIQDSIQVGFAKQVAKFNNYTLTHTGDFPANGAALDSVGGYNVPLPTPNLSFSYGYNAGTTTAILCLSGNLTDRTSLAGFLAGATAVGATITAGLDCTGGPAKPLSPSTFPASASAAFVMTNKSQPSILAIYPASLSYTAAVNTISAAKAITVWNNGKNPVNITSVSVTDGFAQSNNCPATLAVNAKCTFSVTFRPLTTGTYTGTLTIQDSGYGATHTVALSGMS